jgi:hypothetical protein
MADSKGNGAVKEVCRAFRNNDGNCRWGDECKYEHSKGDPIPVPERDYKPKGDCFNFEKDKSCRFGERCRFLHGPEDKRESYRPQKAENTSGEPEICRQYEKRGKCRFGDRCKLKHVEGAKTEQGQGQGQEKKSGDGAGRRRRRRGPKGGNGDGNAETKKERAAAEYDKEGVEICRRFKTDGKCKFGDECNYSHGTPDPKAVPKAGTEKPQGGGGRRRRTPRSGGAGNGGEVGQCYSFTENGSCEYGDECRFKHGEKDSRDFAKIRKPRNPGPCYSFQENGTCDYGDDCRFSHNPADKADE